jgi:type IV pilus assembly protein PilE
MGTDRRCGTAWRHPINGIDNSHPMAASLSTQRRRHHLKGFTLIELMIVVAVIGVLAALALPSFLDSVRKGRRADAVATLTQVQQAQERWRANRGSYASNDVLSTTPPDGLGIGATTVNGYYDVELSGVGAAGYTVTATAKSGTLQASDSACQKLVLRLDGGNIYYSSVDGGGTADTSGTKRCWAR